MSTRGSASRSARPHGDDQRCAGRCLGVDAQLREAQACDPHLRVRGLQRVQDEFVIERAETVERPQRMQARTGIGSVGTREFCERGHDGDIAPQDEELLGGVAPPAIGVGQVLDPLGRRLVEHARLRAGLEILVTQAIDPAPPNLLLQIVGLDLFTQVRAFAGPIGLLDDAAIHVDDVESAIGRGDHIDGAEEGIGRADEFAVLIFVGVGQAGDAILDLDQRAADETADGLGEQQISAQLDRQAVAAEDVLTAGGGEMVEGVVRAQLAGAALRVRHSGDRPDDFVLADVLIRR